MHKKVKGEECARPKDACYRRDARRVKNRLMPVGYEERKKTPKRSVGFGERYLFDSLLQRIWVHAAVPENTSKQGEVLRQKMQIKTQCLFVKNHRLLRKTRRVLRKRNRLLKIPGLGIFIFVFVS